MRIGIDIDGTINNFQDVATDILKREHGLDWSGDTYEIYKGMTIAQIQEFTDKYEDEFIRAVSPLENSCEVIRNWINQKHQVYLITARGYSMAEHTMTWLRRNSVFYTDIYFNCGDKVDCCKWKDVQVMIEDSPHNLKSLNKNNVPYVIFDQKYNKDIYGGLLRTSDWLKIEDFVNFYDV